MDETITKLPALGTPEAAVQTCVKLIARATGQPETVVASWCDLYFSVRRAYERENGDEAPVIIRAEDLLPALRRLWEEVLAIPVTEPTPGQCRQAPSEAEANELTAEPNGPAPGEPAAKGNPAPAGNSYGADAAAYKRETRERLLRLRAEGLTIGELEKVAPSLRHDRIMNVLEGKRMAVEFYRKLAAVLDEIEQKKEGET